MRKWRVRSDFPPNARPQNRHTKGRSPVCLRTCNFRFSLERTHFPQNGHANLLWKLLNFINCIRGYILWKFFFNITFDHVAFLLHRHAENSVLMLLEGLGLALVRLGFFRRWSSCWWSTLTAYLTRTQGCAWNVAAEKQAILALSLPKIVSI